MRLDLAIAAYNEEEVILPTIDLVKASLERVQGLDYRIIVAENGSTDRTLEVVREARLPNVEIFHASKKGKGAALREAASRSDAEYFGYIDADASPHPDAFLSALAIVSRGEAALVVGSRFHRESLSDRSVVRHSSSRAFNLLARSIVGIAVDDTQCPMKVMDASIREILLMSEEPGWLFDLELVARVQRSGATIRTVPVDWTEFRYPKRASKLRLGRDGARALAGMFALRERLRRESHDGA